MKNKKIVMLLSLVNLTILASCGGSNSSINKESSSSSVKASSSTSTTNKTSSTSSNNASSSSSNIVSSSTNKPSSNVPVVNTYTVTWNNYDGELLELDENVIEGTMPSFDGIEPTRIATSEYSYKFTGWSPDISEVYANITYTAVFEEIKNNDDIPNLEGVPEVEPTLSEDKKTITYGFYPQSHVKNTTLINELNSLSPSLSNGWYEYEGEYYTKITAKVYNNETYSFDNGTSIVHGSDYWFKCEPIEWKILSYKDETFFLVSNMLLDAYNFYKDYDNRTIDSKVIYANNYKESDIRTWLNGEFFNTAFALNNTYINEVEVDNSGVTTDKVENTYACENTTDKVYLPSYKDYTNPAYGFDSNATLSLSREAKTTDFARARGAWYNTKEDHKYNGSYWTRSATSEYYYTAWNVNSGGYLSTYTVDDASHCVRPCITISI